MSEKHLTILHSNDLHGDFLPHEDGTGGLSRLSGYVKKTRAEEKNVIYANAGDMFRGSIIDSEYLGLSTIEMMNLLDPDVSAVGNHEVDYGIAHLLFLEKCARFPIINADLYVTVNNARLFTPYLNIERDGMRVLFIALLTQEVISSTKNEKVIGSFIDVADAAKQVGIICDSYRTKDTDLVVLLTHIGIDADRKLAGMLNPDWGVDLIIGGHTHTFMDEPEVVNGVPIVQAGVGSGQIGRFDLVYDTAKHKLAGWKWQCVPITPDTAPEDPVMAQLLSDYKSQTDEKYRRIVTHFARKLTHPKRTQETELGNLYADLLQQDSSFDLMLLGSGSIRRDELGPILEYQDMVEATPYDDQLWMLKVTGAQLRRMVQYVLRDEAWGGHTEFYQFSRGIHIVYRKSTHTIEEFQFRGEDIRDDQEILICLQSFHYGSFSEFFHVPLEEVAANMKPRVVATSLLGVLEELLTTHTGLDAHVEGRLVILD